MQTVTRVLRTLGILVLALAVLAGLLVGYTITRSFPQTRGTLRLPGLGGVVEVVRDADGIPHLYADTAQDLFMAQGYVHAQDRFYQMDFWRHQTAGRLSELYGQASLGPDRFLRTVGWRRIAEQEYSLADRETRRALDAYAAGVNAYLQDRPAADLSLEYSILALNGLSRYRPEDWTPADSLAWAKAMAWNLGGNLDSEIERALLNAQIGPDKTNDYMPVYPGDHPIILPSPAVGGPGLERLGRQVAQVNDQLGGPFKGIGSNNWVIAGSRTTTGQPLLANDPHLAIQMPSIWYEIGLHCRHLTPECPFDEVGYSFAGAPGVIIGHNNRIAWGFTNVGPDVQDLVIERINPSNPNQYEVNGVWTDMTVREETLVVKGQIEPDPEDPAPDRGAYDRATDTTTLKLAVRYTRHGPLISDVYGLKSFAQDTGLDPAYQYAFALRWTALQANHTWRAIFNLNRAQNFDEFRAALRDFAAPSQNMIYADVDGNIGYQVPGNIPIRAKGDGLLPVPGWTDEYEWIGSIPFEALPYSYNPPQGYIATANNAVVGPDYPYLISREWDAGYRAQRIVELIQSQPQISIEYIQQMQGDDMNLGAREVLPYLLALHFEDPKLGRAQEALRGWDDQMRMDSQPAAIYMGFFNALLAEALLDDLAGMPDDYWPGGGDYNWLLLRKLLAEPNSAWWDNAQTPAVETRDDILRQALARGYADLETRLGSDPGRWTWGDLHTSTFENQTVGQSDIALIAGLFNRGPFRTAGGESIVNATGWCLACDDVPDGHNPFAVDWLPSMRMIVDLSNLDNTRMLHTTGQSGHAYHPHYIDMADRWRNINTERMPFSEAAVRLAAVEVLTLTP